MSYRAHIVEKNGHYVIEQRHLPAGVYISRTIVAKECGQDAEGYYTVLADVYGSPLGTLRSKDGTALLTISDDSEAP